MLLVVVRGARALSAAVGMLLGATEAIRVGIGSGVGLIHSNAQVAISGSVRAQGSVVSPSALAMRVVGALIALRTTIGEARP